MPSTLRWKWIVIVAALLGSLAGIFGLPTSGKEAVANLKEHIQLGLDLNGGSHLGLQIQMQDAFKAEADRAIEQLKDHLQKEGFPYTSIDRSEPDSPEKATSVEIAIAGVPADRVSELHRITTETLGQNWMFLSAADTTQRLRMPPEKASRVWQDTVAQTMAVITRRVDGLGVA
jgi:preprotein translocase subunit SecD